MSDRIEFSKSLLDRARKAGIEFRFAAGQAQFRGGNEQQIRYIRKNRHSFEPALIVELVESVFGPCKSAIARDASESSVRVNESH